MIFWISENLFQGITYTVRHGLIRGMKRKGGLGWVPGFFAPGLDTPEERFWRGLDLKNLTVYDVGAFHGILTLFFAARCARVISYEPNPANSGRLLENLRLNSLQNVTLRKFGIGSKPDTATLVFMPLAAGGGSLDQKTVEAMRHSGAQVAAHAIEVTTIDREVEQANLPPPDFVKIDIEGWEIEALRGASGTLARYRPALFLEMHGETIAEKKRKVAEIVAFLGQAGYHNILHVETGTAITAENAAVAMEGHLFCPR